MDNVIVDVETTGLLQASLTDLTFQPHIIEVYVLRVNSKLKFVDEYEQLILPPEEVEIPKFISKMTNIWPDMLVGKPAFSECTKPISKILKKANMFIAHNATFDFGMVDVEFQRAKKTFNTPKEIYCTVEQSMHIFGYRLKNLELASELRGTKEIKKQHRAKQDVKQTFKNFKKLQKIEKGLLCG